MTHRATIAVLFGLHVIWTGLWRNIQAAAYKPNALWFCLVLGSIAIAGAFLDRKGHGRKGVPAVLFAAFVVLAFYFREFVTKPESEANFRVGLVILSSIAMIVVALFPEARKDSPAPAHD